MSRIRAFQIHLGSSALVGLISLALVFLVWYPAPLHTAAGVTSIFLLLVGIDVILGPTMTLVVFKPGKKSLRFDMATIITLQFAAFCYGIWTVAEGRPAWLVFSADRFDLVRVNEIDDRRLDSAPLQYRTPPWSGPRWIAAHAPDDSDRRLEILFEAVFARVDVAQHPELYVPLESAADALRRRARPIAELRKYNSPSDVDAMTASRRDADAWLPLMARAKAMTVLINKESAKVVGVVDLKPWD